MLFNSWVCTDPFTSNILRKAFYWHQKWLSCWRKMLKLVELIFFCHNCSFSLVRDTLSRESFNQFMWFFLLLIIPLLFSEVIHLVLLFDWFNVLFKSLASEQRQKEACRGSTLSKVKLFIQRSNWVFVLSHFKFHNCVSLRSERFSSEDADGVCRCGFCQSSRQQYSHGGWVSLLILSLPYVFCTYLVAQFLSHFNNLYIKN